MTSTGTAVRPSWDSLPASLRHGLTDRVGRIVAAEVATGGFTPGLAARLRLTDGTLFVKGIETGHALAGRYRAEAATNTVLPKLIPSPPMRWHATIAGWEILAFHAVDGRHADLSPGSPDVPLVVEAVASLAPLLTPCPNPHAPPARDELGGVVYGWRELAQAPVPDLDPWAAANLDLLVGLETGWLEAAEGQTLLHGDINRMNLLISDDRVRLVDWAQPVMGAAWLDVADLIPHLILGGHTPAAAERAVAPALTASGVDDQTLTGYAAAFAGYWARSSRAPAPPGVPNLRPYQARAATAALSWVRHRTRR